MAEDLFSPPGSQRETLALLGQLPVWSRYTRPLRVAFPVANQRLDVAHTLGVIPNGFQVVWADAAVTAAPGVQWTPTTAYLQADAGNANAVVIFFELREEEASAGPPQTPGPTTGKPPSGLVLHAPTHQPGGTDPLVNAAWVDQANTFTLNQTISGTLDVTGGSGTDYSAAPIEIRTSAMPRISFHWPGVVASQIGMNSDGIIRTFDNPGTGYERFGAGSTTVYGTLTVTGATSLQGALTFAADVWHTTGADGWQRLLFTSGGPSYLKGSNVVFRNSSDADIGSIAANGDFMCSGSIGCTSNIWRSNCHTSGGYVYPANVAASAAVQSSWYIAGHSSYGLYINTGLYIVGGIWTGADILSGATVKAATSLWERGRSVCVGDPINWAPVFYTAEGANVGGSIACYYSLVGRTVFWSVYIINFSVGTATGYIRCALPLACTLATYVQGACRNYVPGIGDRPGYSVAGVPDANWLAFYRCDVNAAAWPAGVGHILATGHYWLP